MKGKQPCWPETVSSRYGHRQLHILQERAAVGAAEQVCLQFIRESLAEAIA
jgi:hypothetical protein